MLDKIMMLEVLLPYNRKSVLNSQTKMCNGIDMVLRTGF